MTTTKRNQKYQPALTLDISKTGIGWITVDVKGETQNTLKAEFAEEFESIFKKIEASKDIKALVIISGKKDGFIAGADISLLQSLTSKEAVTDLAKTGHKLFNQIENLSIPVIAAINGACLGGGLELALACSYRVSTSENVSVFGLPEVKLGLLPGGGGTQRLPRLIGIASSLDLMLTGRQVNAQKAKKLGLIDELVALANLPKAAEKIALKLVARKKKIVSQLAYQLKPKSLLTLSGFQKLLFESNVHGRKFLFEKAKQAVNKKTHGNYPSPPKIVDCVAAGLEEGFQAGLNHEATAFAELVMSPEAKQLMSIFFATTELKKNNGVDSDISAAPVQRVGILGGGLMGAGIAYVSAEKAGKKVRIKDQNVEGVNHALKYCWELYRKNIKRKRMTISDASRRFSFITGTTNYQGFKRCEIVIEAVFENLELKQQMLKDIESTVAGRAIFASNTSSIPISKIASVARYPEKVIGLHYFSPVEKMPLLEIVVTDKTSPETIASCVSFGKQQGKTVIVVKDGVGFYTSRILAPYINEAGHLIAEGVAIDKIDEALTNAGFPVGPITLLDEVGIDIGTKISPILEEAFGKRMSPPKIFEKLESDNRKGKKNKRGFYSYQSNLSLPLFGQKLLGKKLTNKKEVDQSIYKLLDVNPENQASEKMIAERCLLQMVNEAVNCLQDGIIRLPRDGDIGAIFGLGFPPFLGGPFRYIDSYGTKAIVDRLKELEQTCGFRFKPSEVLVSMAKKNETFY